MGLLRSIWRGLTGYPFVYNGDLYRAWDIGGYTLYFKSRSRSLLARLFLEERPQHGAAEVFRSFRHTEKTLLLLPTVWRRYVASNYWGSVGTAKFLTDVLSEPWQLSFALKRAQLAGRDSTTWASICMVLIDQVKGRKGTASVLVQALQSNDPMVREHAEAALHSIGVRGSAAASILRRAFQCGDREVEEAAAKALRQLDCDRRADPLLAFARSSVERLPAGAAGTRFDVVQLYHSIVFEIEKGELWSAEWGKFLAELLEQVRTNELQEPMVRAAAARVSSSPPLLAALETFITDPQGKAEVQALALKRLSGQLVPTDYALLCVKCMNIGASGERLPVFEEAVGALNRLGREARDVIRNAKLASTLAEIVERRLYADPVQLGALSILRQVLKLGVFVELCIRLISEPGREKSAVFTAALEWLEQIGPAARAAQPALTVLLLRIRNRDLLRRVRHTLRGIGCEPTEDDNGELLCLGRYVA